MIGNRNRNRREPYVGVSGVVSPEQQTALLANDIEERLANTARRLAIGVKATHKPQFDDIENKHGRQWYPVGDEISSALNPDIRSTFNIVQAQLKQEHVDTNQAYPELFFDKIRSRTSSVLDAIQIDQLRYEQSPEKYAHVIRAMSSIGLQTIVQCHSFAMEAGPQEAMKALEILADKTEIDYVLFDASHGRAEELNPGILKRFLEVAYNDPYFSDKGTNFGIAGGLSGENLKPLLGQIMQDYPDISWDAEGRLHDKKKAGGTGSLNLDRSKHYLEQSVDLAERYC